MGQLVDALGFQQLEFLLDREKELHAASRLELAKMQEMWRELADCFTRLLTATFRDGGKRQSQTHYRVSTEEALKIIEWLHRKETD